MNSLDVRKEYACARPFSRASHLDVFEQPAKRNIPAEKRPPASLRCDALARRTKGVRLRSSILARLASGRF
jgi:hypothetical protein